MTKEQLTKLIRKSYCNFVTFGIYGKRISRATKKGINKGYDQGYTEGWSAGIVQGYHDGIAQCQKEQELLDQEIAFLEAEEKAAKKAKKAKAKGKAVKATKKNKRA